MTPIDVKHFVLFVFLNLNDIIVAYMHLDISVFSLCGSTTQGRNFSSTTTGMEGVLQHEARHDQPRLKAMVAHQEESGQLVVAVGKQHNTVTTSGMLRRVMGRSQTFYTLRSSEESLASSSTRSSSWTEASFDSPLMHNVRQIHWCRSTRWPSEFRLDVLRAVSSPETNTGPEFTLLRKVIEPHLRKARLARELSRPVVKSAMPYNFSVIGCAQGFPYPSLRAERRFLYCQDSFPLHDVLSSALGLEDLTKAGLVDEADLLLPMLNREKRIRFQAVYDSFVQSVCLPFIHSMAMTNHVFQYHRDCERVTYRYQAFPTIKVSRPEITDLTRDQGAAPQSPSNEGPTCDTILGYSPGCLTFHVPLTPCGPSNSMYTETRPGREDWHPLDTKAIGLGYLFDGARCLSFYLPNTSNQCSVALTFRVQISQSEDDFDAFSIAGPGYYEEAVVNLQPGNDAAISKKRGQGCFLTPDHRNGYPFL